MEVNVKREALGYGKPPWIFKGSALYQLHLVKAETARAFIPREFRLVEAFGYTLGGFFLANYDDSPAGVFDELVVIAGIVWNAPTSCAWAARVLVNSDEACDHGRKDVGLPSQVARFSKRISAVRSQPASKFSSFLNMIGMGDSDGCPKHGVDVQVTEIMGPALTDICTIHLSSNVPEKKMGPAINISLPSFSGCTKYNPNLLKYSCRIKCRVRAVRPAKISRPSPTEKNGGQKPTDDQSHSARNFASEETTDKRRNLSISVMLSKPILALEFQCLEMQVEAPTVVSYCPLNSLKSC